MPESYANPRFVRRYLKVAATAEGRGADEHRRELLRGLAGAVCEVGAGQGLNFAHYPPSVTQVLAVEPEPTLREHAEAAADVAPVAVTVLDGTAESLPVPDQSCEAVVMSLVLCTVKDQTAALAEVRRVMRPGGEVRFYEHVRSEHRLVGAGEDLVAPLWAHLAGGCHPNRDSVKVISEAGFEVREVRRFGFSPQRGVPPFAHVLGRATRS